MNIIKTRGGGSSERGLTLDELTRISREMIAAISVRLQPGQLVAVAQKVRCPFCGGDIPLERKVKYHACPRMPRTPSPRRILTTILENGTVIMVGYGADLGPQIQALHEVYGLPLEKIVAIERR